MAENNKVRICDVIDYKKDIEPYGLIKLYSGVGSGKSYFATKMITGSKEHGIPKQNVLIITSRRSKVEETLKEMGILITERITKNGNLSFNVWKTGEERPCEYEEYLKEIECKTDWGDFKVLTYNKSVVCTNAYISAHLRYVYDSDDPSTHIWNKFDAIIIDEVHSLVTDATYQSATFDVLAFIEEYLKLYKNNQLPECACKHLILMTGTPQPFEALAELNFPKELTNNLNWLDKCKNVIPKNIILIDEQTAHLRLRELIAIGEKVICFTNHTATESGVKKIFGLPDSTNVGVSFSSEEKKHKLTEKEQDKIDYIENSISGENLIPEEIQLFVTTSRNKEGINIHNNEYHNMFVETHLMYDVVQMAGRIRSGLDNLYIITNVRQFECYNDMTDILFTKKTMVANEYYSSDDKVNEYLKAEYLGNEKELDKKYDERKTHIMHYVNYIENRFSYIKYNVFNQKFEFFYMKELAGQMVQAQVEGFREMLASGTNEYVQRWFPTSKVSRELSVNERAQIYLKDVLGNNLFVTLSEEELQKHTSFIQKLFNSTLKSINPILHLIDENYNCKKSGKNYILYYGKEDPRVKKKPMGKRAKH